MNVRKLLQEDRAVSPVIGVILMVAITVILAAVIGTFVLNLGGEMNKNAPTANLGWEQSGTSPALEATVTHEGGDGVDVDRISFTLNDNDASVAATSISATASGWDGDSSGKITAGESVTFSAGYETGDKISVVWTSEDGATSSVLGSFTFN